MLAPPALSRVSGAAVSRGQLEAEPNVLLPVGQQQQDGGDVLWADRQGRIGTLTPFFS